MHNTKINRPWNASAIWRACLRVSCAAVLVVPLAACGGGSSEEAAGDPNVVTVWFNGESVPEDAFASLKEEHNITVEWDIRGDTMLTDMLRMREAGEELPDLIEIDASVTPAFLEAKLLAPMNEQITKWEEEDPELYATVPPSVWEDGTYDGELYNFPNKSLVDAMYYNIDLLEQANVAPPPYDTYDDLLEAARQVQAALPDLPAYYGTGGTSADRMFRWLYSFGTPFEGPVPQLTSEQGVATISWLQTMFNDGLVDPEFMIGQQDEAKGAFVAGQLPFLDEGLNGGPAFMLDDFVYGEDWATAVPPVDVADGGSLVGFPRGWSMTAGKDNNYQSSLVMRYLSQPEIAAERYLELETGIVQSIPVLENDIPAAQPFFTPELMDAFRTLEVQVPPSTFTNSVGEVLVNLVEEVTVTGSDETPQQIAERYQAELDELD